MFGKQIEFGTDDIVSGGQIEVLQSNGVPWSITYFNGTQSWNS